MRLIARKGRKRELLIFQPATSLAKFRSILVKELENRQTVSSRESGDHERRRLT